MPGSSFGTIFKLTTFGESHGKAIGGIIEGCPAGLEVNLGAIQQELDRRRPGQSEITTRRKELDQIEFLSGIFEGKTLGTPIGFLIPNQDAESKDYSHIKDVYRPSHADFTYDAKYGLRDYRGGGRSSARETACRVVAGAIAKQLLKDLSVQAFVSQLGKEKLEKSYLEIDLSKTDNNVVRCPDPEAAERFIKAIEKVKKEKDTLGGAITCVIKGVPAGWGEPIFDKLHADLGKAMLSINAVKGFEVGSGFASVQMKGSQHNDRFTKEGKTATNYSGGIQGGISNGEDIYFKIAFKPVATIMQDQASVNKAGEEVIIKNKGRHDPCIVPRAVPIVEAMAALVLANHYLISRTNKV